MTEAPPIRQRTNRLPRSARRAQLLQVALRVFVEQGYHAASMDEIAEVAGISKPMVYAYLGAKEDLFAACVRREGDRLLAAVVAVVGESEVADLPPEELLWRGLRAFFGFVHEHRDGWSVLHRQARGEGGALPPGTGLRGLRHNVVDVVSRVFSRAKAVHGSERTAGTEVDLRAFAHALVGAIESLAGWMIEHPDEDPETTASRLMNFVWVGFDHLLRGQVWRPHGVPPSTTTTAEMGL